jgi:hypothetical protein
MHCKCRVTEKLIRLLVKNALGETQVITKLNDYLQSLGVSYQVETTTTKKYPGVADSFLNDATIASKNSLRGDKVRLVLKEHEKLIDICIPVGDELQNDLRQRVRNLWKAWAKIEPLLTDVTDPKTNRPRPDFTPQELLDARNSIKFFEEALVSAYPSVTEEGNDVITPYLHFIVCHLADLMDIHNRYARYQNQGRITDRRILVLIR